MRLLGNIPFPSTATIAARLFRRDAMILPRKRRLFRSERLIYRTSEARRKGKEGERGGSRATDDRVSRVATTTTLLRRIARRKFRRVSRESRREREAVRVEKLIFVFGNTNGVRGKSGRDTASRVALYKIRKIAPVRPVSRDESCAREFIYRRASERASERARAPR